MSYVVEIQAAKRCEDIFPVADPIAVESRFRDLAMVLHPDRCKDPAAADAMARLNVLRDEATKKLAEGTWGRDPAPRVTIETKAHVFTTVQPFAAGDLFDVYWAVYQKKPIKTGEPDGGGALIKLLRDPKDDDLARAEWDSLNALWASKAPNAATFQRYLPRQIETAKIAVGGKQRRANVLKLYAGRFTVADVMKAFPHGIDPRDMAWMFRRVLEALSWVHENGIVHGAILPEHVLLNAVDHGAKIVDWSYSVKTGSRLKAMVPRHAALYPPEVTKKLAATTATDVFMAARLAWELVGEQPMPFPIAQLLNACLLQNPHRRHTSATEVYQRFDVILRRLYGPPKFRPFAMPARGE